PGEQSERGRREHRHQHDAGFAAHRGSAGDLAVRRHQHVDRGLHPAVVLDPRVHLAPPGHRPHGLAHGARLAARGRGTPLRSTMEIERVKGKIMEGQPGFPRQYGPSRSDHQPGIPFFPQETARDFVLIFLLTAILFFLAAVVTPFLGPARSPQISELIVPDWYLLFSWGLLKLADVFPQFIIGDGTPLKTNFNAAFWGDILSGIPVIFLLILPFIDRGREARPAKAPVRSAFGIAFLLAWIFTASLYSIREVVAQRWQTPNGSPLINDIAMKWFFIIPPVLVGLTSYIGLRRLGFAWVLSVLEPNMNTLLLLPMFAVLTAYLGVRRPYSTYEYLLNECYQCGKCHTVCPVTKVEDDALGGLNLVYNTFKKQHDGVPLWTCLACDACSAVCPLDIHYGDTNHGIIFDSSIKLLRAVGIQPMILDRSFMKCCGHDQLWQGKVDVFERMRDYNTKIIKMLGVKTFITSCAEGYRTFKLDYKLDGVRVVHITQFLYERGLRIPPQAETAKKIRVAFQDPCRSGRQMPIEPVFEEPRELIKRVDNAELVELKTFRADAQCCGVAQMMYCNDKTKGLTRKRMDEAVDVDADYLLTACPKCL